MKILKKHILCKCVCIYTYTVYIYIYIFICLCAYVCVYICIWMKTSVSLHGCDVRREKKSSSSQCLINVAVNRAEVM